MASTRDAPISNQEGPTGRVEPQADYRLALEGRDLSSQLKPRLISLTLAESRGGESDALDLVLDDSKNDLAIPKRGANVTLAIGWRGQRLVDKGTFTIDEVEHSGAPDIITVRARSASMTNQMHERREHSWHRQTIGAIVRAIATRYSLRPAVGDTLANILIGHIDQTHESDMSFLTRLAKRYDAVMNVKDLRLLFMPIGMGTTVSGRPFSELHIKRSCGDQHRYHIAQRENYTAVRAHYHANQKGKRKSVVVGGENNSNVKVLPEDYATEAEARAAARGEYARTQRGQAT
ncbi:MAG: contractile injection system protein, VgrG/Pvc8 family, partial [Janthinobacterium lividum]